MEDGGPIFFSQERVGLGGRTFVALEISIDAAGRGSRSSVPIQARDDSRVTRIGRMMRATAMDKLPQLWNILVAT